MYSRLSDGSVVLKNSDDRKVIGGILAAHRYSGNQREGLLCQGIESDKVNGLVGLVYRNGERAGTHTRKRELFFELDHLF